MTYEEQLDQLNHVLDLIKRLEQAGSNNRLYNVKLSLINEIIELEDELGIKHY